MLSEFERKAWANRASSADHKPEMALKVALDDLKREAGADVTHIVVVTLHEDSEGNFMVDYYSAGSSKTLEVESMLMRAIRYSQDQFS